MEDFRWKAWNVVEDHMTIVWETITDASVVSRETLKTELIITELDDFEVESVDMLNACMQAFVKEKVWAVLGPKFKGAKKTGKTAV